MSFIQASASICVFTVGDMNVDVSNSSSSKVLSPDNSISYELVFTEHVPSSLNLGNVALPAYCMEK